MRLGELCAGYGGLGIAVEEVFGATTAWFSEYDAAPSKILAHHWPDVPNYGDMTKIDWAGIERVDIISGGTPCQDLSGAGKRAGMTEGTRSNLWVQMREAIAIQRPRYVVWENVRGAYSATAASDLEQCPGCMGDPADGGTVLRALGRVLGDLSDLGYDCQWRGLRAADVGACHGRFRVFVIAQNADIATGDKRWFPASGQTQSGRTRTNPGGRSGTHLAQAVADHSSAAWGRSKSGHLGEATEPAAEPRECISFAANADRWDDDGRVGNSKRSQERREAATGGGEGSGAAPYTVRLGSGGRASEPEQARGDDAPIRSGAGGTNWGAYEPAIRRWEAQLGRPAPRPTEPSGRNNGHRLSPRFTEWMMGLPDGWVTDPAIGISRNDQLKACGNGVVPQQAKAALTDMLQAFQAKDIAA